jgi:cell filamentation protein, protein adenylyltransferase
MQINTPSGGYDLKGLYCLEEYYARNLGAYYDAISIGPSHNYYLGREEVDITPWLDCFIAGMAYSFERALQRIVKESPCSLLNPSEFIEKALIA